MSKAKAFTLIELLVVIAIIGVLAALLLAAIGGMKARSAQTATAANLRQIGAALTMYAADNNGCFPTVHGSVPYKINPSTNEDISWQQQLDSYIGFTDSSVQTIGARKIFIAPSSINRGTPLGTNGFFLGVYAAKFDSEQSGDTNTFSPLRLSKILRPAMHILAGEIGVTGGTAGDADNDDWSQDMAFGPMGGTNARIIQILFVDGHVGSFKRFDTNQMTVRYEGVQTNGAGYPYPF